MWLFVIEWELEDELQEGKSLGITDVAKFVLRVVLLWDGQDLCS